MQTLANHQKAEFRIESPSQGNFRRPVPQCRDRPSHDGPRSSPVCVLWTHHCSQAVNSNLANDTTVSLPCAYKSCTCMIFKFIRALEPAASDAASAFCCCNSSGRPNPAPVAFSCRHAHRFAIEECALVSIVWSYSLLAWLF